VARLLGPEGMGLFSLASTVAFYLALLADLGLGTAGIFLLGRGSSPRAVAGTTLLAGGVAGLGAGLIALGLVPFADTGLLAGLDAGLLLIVAGTVPLLVLGTHLESLLLGLRRTGASVGLGILRRVVQLGLTAGALLLVERSLVLALLCLPLSTLPSIVAGLRLLVRRTGSLRGERATFREALPYGLRSWIGVVAQVLNYRADLPLINLFLGAGAMGVYGMAVILTEPLLYVPQAVALVLFPRASADEEPRRTIRTLHATRTVLALGALGGVVLWIAAPLLRRVVAGDEFAEADLVIRILIPGIVAAALAKVLSSDLAGRGRPGLVSVAGIVAAAINIGLNLMLIPSMELAGAALASAVSYTASTLLIGGFFLRASGARFGDLLRPERLRISAA
jgi:stage V sporulation protein B